VNQVEGDIQMGGEGVTGSGVKQIEFNDMAVGSKGIRDMKAIGVTHGGVNGMTGMQQGQDKPFADVASGTGDQYMQGCGGLGGG